MNAMSPPPAAARRAASPYARRLAAERDVPLDALIGSGPGGRVVAADILGYVPQVAETQPVAAPAPAPASVPSVFSITVALEALNRLNEKAAEVGLTFELVDVALRALRCAMQDAAPEAAARGIALEIDGGQVLLDPDANLSIGALRKARLDAIGGDAAAETGPALISMQVLAATRVRAVSMPVLPGRAMRLRLLAADHADEATALLSVSPDAIAEPVAMKVLETFAEMLEQPFRLLA